MKKSKTTLGKMKTETLFSKVLRRGTGTSQGCRPPARGKHTSQTNHLTLHLKELGKEKETKSEVRRRKEIRIGGNK